MDTIRAETEQAVHDDKVDLHYVLNRCPRLEGFFLELLRVTASSTTMRKVIKPTEIGGKILRPGYRVLIPYRQLHYDEGVFGEDANIFDPGRFLANKEMSHHPSFKPFGSGANYCPGRVIARLEVFVFIALILHRYDVDLARASNMAPGDPVTDQFPKLCVSRPCIGIMGPAQGDDVIINVKQRSRL